MDPKLLAVFDEIYRTRSIPLAAENLGLPQPSVNIALGRLRLQHGDALFVRTSRGLRPTSHAAGLIAEVRQTLERLQPSVPAPRPPPFDPSRCARTLRIGMGDLGRLALLPALSGRLLAAAPSLHIEIDPLSADMPQRLEAGEVDLALDVMPPADGRFLKQKLFDDDYDCVVRRDHPRVHEWLTPESFERERHVVVTGDGSGNDRVEHELGRLGVRRDVALRLPGFLGLAALVAATDLLLTVPQRIARALERGADLKRLAPPFGLPSLPIGQHWHERRDEDPAHRWLRSVVSDLFLG